jgi:uncharacterized protein
MKSHDSIHASLWPILFATVLLVGACKSDPVRYYTLATTPRASTASDPATPLSINVDSVSIPARLNQPQIVVRRGGQELAMLEGARWASPLNDELRDELSAGVAERLSAVDFHGLPQAHASTTYVVDVNVGQMEGGLGGSAFLDASWTVKFRGKTRSCNIHLSDDAGKDLDGLVASYQRMATKLAGAIATSIEDDGNGKSCSLVP